MARFHSFAFGLIGILAFSISAQAQNAVQNGDFENGLTGWSIWSAPPGFWSDSWIHSNDCDIWVPTNGCPLAGGVSHAQKKGNDAPNAHGGIYQVIAVVPGNHYRVGGNWSGGVTGNVAGNNGTWWEVVVYDGIVDDATIDAGLRPQDVLIAKREVSNLGNGEPFQFQWESFDGGFTAQSNSVTLAFKVGSFSTFEAAGYHDEISVEAVPALPIPTLSSLWLLLLAVLLPAVAVGALLKR